MIRVSVVTTFLLLTLFETYGLAHAKCSAGWQQFGDYCYTAVTTNITSPNFNDSLSVCTNILGNLPTFNRRKDWTDFTSFVTVNKISGLSALGYIRYTINSHYTSMYNGQSPRFTNWGRGQPNTSYTFSLIRYSSNNFWETGNWTTAPLKIICQQGLVHDSNNTYIPCATVSRCFSQTLLHRFSTDPYRCPSGGMVKESDNIGVASSIHIPSLTESLYEMIDPISGRVLMAYNNSGRKMAITFGYSTTNWVIHVFATQLSTTVPYALLWSNGQSIHSMIIPFNNGEYNHLIKFSEWETAAANFYMFPSHPTVASCDLFTRSTASSLVSGRVVLTQMKLNGNWNIVCLLLIFLLLSY